VYDAIATEERSKPAVSMVNEYFADDAVSAASGRLMPGARFVPTVIPPECSVIEQIEAGASAVIDEIIAGLTKPLTEEEKSPKPKKAEKTSGIIFQGSLEEVNRFFYRRGWTDGLPVIPPTEEAVAEMLTGTDLPADHVVGKLPPRMGKATVEKIAINAVMAGALPTYMPVLIAAVQATLEPQAMLHWGSATTAAPGPFWVINGPIRKDLNFNCGQGAFSPGDIAQSTIGRTIVGLFRYNIAGARKGIESMGTFGNPAMNTMIIAENEEANPWNPMHVDQGLKKEDSAISVILTANPVTVSSFGTDPEGILRGLMASFNVSRGGGAIILQPASAKSFAAGGWTKKDIVNFIFEQAPRVPVQKTGQYWGASTPMPNAYDDQGRPQLAKGVLMREADTVPSVRDPNAFNVLVAGGAGGLMVGLVPAMVARGWVTKKIELPKNWNALVKKYKDVVPAFIKY
jgi:hypothetical protein